MDDAIDFEREGLLDGCRGAARQQRRDLLRFLFDRGVTVDEARAAIAADRLAMLASERALAGEPRYSLADIAERTGLPIDLLLDFRRAIGVGRPDPHDRAFGEEDLHAARLLGLLLAAGSREGLLQTMRVLGRGMSQAARSIREALAEAFLEAATDEREIALLGVQATEQLLPLAGPLMQQILRIHLLEQIRQEQITMAELRSSDRLPGTREVAICFADLVGFTQLGERLAVEELEQVASQLEELAAELVEPPVHLVKTIGDAVMLVGFQAAPLVDTALALVERAGESTAGLPPLRAGLAWGTAANHSGDWYGRPVNLASRVTAVAPAGAVVCTDQVRQATADGYRWTALGQRALKGIEGHITLFQVARGRDGPGTEPAAPR